VLDQVGNPVAKASVQAVSLRGSRQFALPAVEADEQGRFQLTAVPVGFVALVAHGPGQARLVELVDVGRGGLRDVDLVLSPAARLSGTVLHDGEEPLAEARVCVEAVRRHAVPELAPQCVSISAEGRFVLDQLPAGPVLIAVDGPGVTRALRTDVIVPAEGVTLFVNRLSAITGTVRMPTGEGAPGATVAIGGSGVWPAREVTAAADGTYRIDAVPVGVYEAEARLGESLVSARQFGLEVSGGRELTVDLDLEQGSELSGRVIEAGSGRPLAGVRVVVSSDVLSLAPAESMTGPEGAFSVPGLIPGQYWLSLAAPGYVTVSGAPCTVPGTEVEVTLQRAAAIEGQVVDQRGFPVAGATVEVESGGAVASLTGGSSLASPSSLSALSSSSFLSGGRSQALAGSGGELGVFHGLENIQFSLAAPANVPLEPSSPGATGGLGATAPAAPPRPGSQPSPATPVGVGLPVAAARPALVQPTRAATTSEEGRFRLEGLAPGPTVLRARHPSYVSGTSSSVSLRAGHVAEDVTIVIGQGGEVWGRVTDRRGFPVMGAVVRVDLPGDGGSRTVVASPDGSYAVAGVAGAIVLVASAPGYLETVHELRLPRNFRRHEVDLEIETARRRLRGRVVYDDESPAAEAQVSARTVGAGAVRVRRATTEADGRFVIEGLGDGPVVVEAQAAGARGQTWADDEDEEVTLWLERPGAFVVEARDPHNGGPIADCSVEILPAAGPRLRQVCVEGRAAVTGLAAGPARIWVRAPQRTTVEEDAEVSSGSDGEDRQAWVTVELPLATRVRGTVYDVDDGVVAGAKVALDELPRYVVGGQPGRWAQTDGEGRFDLDGVPQDEESELHLCHGDHGCVFVEVGPFYPNDEPDLEIVLDGDRPSGTRRFGGVALDLVGEAGRAVVAAVAPGGAAERGGLRPGDRVVAVDGQSLSGVSGVARALRGRRGSPVLILVERGEEELLLVVERERVATNW
jgi:hypothetical protein